MNTPWLDERIDFLKKVIAKKEDLTGVLDRIRIAELNEYEQIKAALQEFEELKVEKDKPSELVDGAYYWVKIHDNSEYDMAIGVTDKSSGKFYFRFDLELAIRAENVNSYRLIEQPK